MMEMSMLASTIQITIRDKPYDADTQGEYCVNALDEREIER